MKEEDKKNKGAVKAGAKAKAPLPGMGPAPIIPDKEKMAKLLRAHEKLKRDYSAFKTRANTDLSKQSKALIFLEEQRRISDAEFRSLTEDKNALAKELNFKNTKLEKVEEEHKRLIDETYSKFGRPDRIASGTRLVNVHEKNHLVKNSRRESDSEADNWLMSYSDYMTLLLAVFIVLFSISMKDSGKVQVMTQSIAETFGGRQVDDTREIRLSAPEPTPKRPLMTDIDVLSEEVMTSLSTMDLGDAVDVNLTDEGLVITLQDKITFYSGESTLLEEAKGVMHTVAAILTKNQKYDVVVAGHTDNVPIDDERFRSNWELSTSRASNIVRFLSEVEGVAPERLTAAGYGEYHPIATNDTASGRGRNRRVEIKILTDK